MRLSPNFTLAEMTRSATAARLGIDNNLHEVIDAPIIQNLIDLCTDILEPVRAHFGHPIRPSSAYRNVELNRSLGGKENSQHCFGQAVDFEIAGIPNASIVHFINDNLTFDQLIAEMLENGDGSAGWVHVSYKRHENRNELISWLGHGRGYVPGLEFVA